MKIGTEHGGLPNRDTKHILETRANEYHNNLWRIIAAPQYTTPNTMSIELSDIRALDIRTLIETCKTPGSGLKRLKFLHNILESTVGAFRNSICGFGNNMDPNFRKTVRATVME